MRQAAKEQLVLDMLGNKTNGGPFYILRDDEVKGKANTYNEALEKLHRLQGQSWDYAMKYGGWTIKSERSYRSFQDTDVNINKLEEFIPAAQLTAIRSLLKGEEGNWYKEKMRELIEIWETMPVTYEQESKGKDAIVHLHYFSGGSDWWITEKDKLPEQHQAFGKASMGGNPPEWGYISIEELKAHPAIELDLHWTPQPLEGARPRPDKEWQVQGRYEVVIDAGKPYSETADTIEGVMKILEETLKDGSRDEIDLWVYDGDKDITHKYKEYIDNIGYAAAEKRKGVCRKCYNLKEVDDDYICADCKEKHAVATQLYEKSGPDKPPDKPQKWTTETLLPALKIALDMEKFVTDDDGTVLFGPDGDYKLFNQALAKYGIAFVVRDREWVPVLNANAVVKEATLQLDELEPIIRDYLSLHYVYTPENVERVKVIVRETIQHEMTDIIETAVYELIKEDE